MDDPDERTGTIGTYGSVVKRKALAILALCNLFVGWDSLAFTAASVALLGADGFPLLGSVSALAALLAATLALRLGEDRSGKDRYGVGSSP